MDEFDEHLNTARRHAREQASETRAARREAERLGRERDLVSREDAAKLESAAKVFLRCVAGHPGTIEVRPMRVGNSRHIRRPSQPITGWPMPLVRTVETYDSIHVEFSSGWRDYAYESWLLLPDGQLVVVAVDNPAALNSILSQRYPDRIAFQTLQLGDTTSYGGPVRVSSWYEVASIVPLRSKTEMDRAGGIAACIQASLAHFLVSSGLA